MKSLRLTSLLLLTVLSACCVPHEAISHARTQHAVNVGHANDESLSRESRLIGETNADAWAVQIFNLTGDKPEDEGTRERTGMDED